MEEQNQLAIDHFMQTGMYITLSSTHSFQLLPNSGAVIGRFHLCFTEKLRNLQSRRMFANSSWGNAATAFSLSLQFRVCGRTCYKLYSRNRCILREGKRLGGETVGFKYPVWLLHNIDSKCLFACPYFVLQGSALSEAIHFIRPGIVRHSIHHVRSND